MRKRNISIDVLRVFATVLVVFQHACGNTSVEGALNSFAKIAVPIFLLITGYYYQNTQTRNGELRQMKKIFSYAFSITALYFCIELVISLLKHRVGEYLVSFIKIPALLQFFVLNSPLVGDHTWYLWGLFYVLVLVYVFDKFASKKLLYLFAIISLVFSWILGIYSTLFFSQKLHYLAYRNFLFTCLPYFVCGMFLYDQKEWVEEKKKYWPISTLVFTILGFGEYYVLKYCGFAEGGYYFSTLLISVSLFAFFLTTDVFDAWQRLASFGKKYSLYIYAFHVEVVVFEKRFLSMEHGMGFIGFILVLFVSIGISVAFDWFLNECRRGLYGKSTS